MDQAYNLCKKYNILPITIILEDFAEQLKQNVSEESIVSSYILLQEMYNTSITLATHICNKFMISDTHIDDICILCITNLHVNDIHIYCLFIAESIDKKYIKICDIERSLYASVLCKKITFSELYIIKTYFKENKNIILNILFT